MLIYMLTRINDKHLERIYFYDDPILFLKLLALQQQKKLHLILILFHVKL